MSILSMIHPMIVEIVQLILLHLTEDEVSNYHQTHSNISSGDHENQWEILWQSIQ